MPSSYSYSEFHKLFRHGETLSLLGLSLPHSFSRKMRYFRGIKQQRKRGNVHEFSACLDQMGLLLDCSRNYCTIILNTDARAQVVRRDGVSFDLIFTLPPPFLTPIPLFYSSYISYSFLLLYVYLFSLSLNGIG